MNGITQTAEFLASLPQYARLSVRFALEEKNFYKEDFHQMLTQVEHRVSQRKEGQGIGFLGLNMTRENSTITYQDGRMIYGNLGAIDSLTIEDNKVEYHYTEFSDQNIITPILYHFEANVLLLIQAFRELTQDFVGTSLNITFFTESNVDIVYYDSYDLFKVEKEWMLTYRIPAGGRIEAKMDLYTEPWEANRRFLQLFSTDVNTRLPYLVLDTEDFKEKYRAIFG